ncbi:MAG: phosphatidylserine decarboxylase [Alphaproteobacteria bacterium]|jgi:phosphatidylserine decarboxylase
MSSIKSILCPPIHKEGYKFVSIFTIVTVLLGVFVWSFLFYIGLVLTIWCYYFFRDPKRCVPQSEKLVISPADGKVCVVDKATPPAELGLSDVPMTRIGVFMNVFDCHVNRTPVAGTVKKIAYHKGQFFNASLDKASQKNERNSLIVQDTHGDNYGVVQIAGLVARRILCETEEETVLRRGDRFGIIRFGSRVDIYVPDHVIPAVGLGQTCYAGETILAHKHGDKPETFVKI